MRITQAQYNELCTCGKLHFSKVNLYCINWLTIYKKLAILLDEEEHTEIISLQITD